MPAGLSFDAAARQLVGTPLAALALTTYRYTATDGNGDSAERPFTITIRPQTADDPPDGSRYIGGPLYGTVTPAFGERTASGVLSLNHANGREADGGAFVEGDHTGTYGMLTVTDPKGGPGRWQYRVDHSRGVVVNLGQGRRLQERFTITTDRPDLYAEATVLIEIIGRNMKPVVKSVTASRDTAPTGALIRLSGVVTDRNPGETEGLAYTWSVRPAALGGSFVDRNARDTVYVMGSRGVSASYTLLLRATDQHGGVGERSVTVRQSESDGRLRGDLSASLTEDGLRSGETSVVSHGLAAAGLNGVYGRLVVANDGDLEWVYTLANNAAVQGLSLGQQVREQFILEPVSPDVAGALATVTINGANDPPRANITGASASLPVGAALRLDGSGSSDPDRGETASLRYAWGTDPSSAGVFDDARAAATVWTPATAGAVTLRLRVTDAQGLSDVETVALTVSGAIVGDSAGRGGTLNERANQDGTAPQRLSGRLSYLNPPVTLSDTSFHAQILEGRYGQFAIAADGAWTYALNDDSGGAADALRAGDTVEDAFGGPGEVEAGLDATGNYATASAADYIRITIKGVNDRPQATVTTPAAALQSASAQEHQVAGDATDPDFGHQAALSYAWSTAPANIGVFANPNAASTTWSAPSVDAPLTVTLRFRARDPDGATGSGDSAVITVNPVRLAGDRILLFRTMDELDPGAANNKLMGRLDLSGFDSVVARDLENEFSRFILRSNGEWEYIQNTRTRALQALVPDDIHSEDYRVRAHPSDGSPVRTIGFLRFRIFGKLEPVTGPRTGTFSEDDSGDRAVVRGRLDWDLGDRLLGVDRNGGIWNRETRQGRFGTFVMEDERGNWRYTLDTNNAEVQGLTDRAALPDRFVVAPYTPLYESVEFEFTVKGVNDPPLVTARADRVAVRPAAVVELSGAAIDADHGEQKTLSYTWIVGPAAGVFADRNDPSTTWTAPDELTASSYTFTLLVQDKFGATAEAAVLLRRDSVPFFDNDYTLDTYLFKEGAAIAVLPLPTAQGGDGVLRYALAPSLPPGLSYDEQNRRISGKPATPVPSALRYTYTATDTNGDAAVLQFSIRVLPDSSTQNQMRTPRYIGGDLYAQLSDVSEVSEVSGNRVARGRFRAFASLAEQTVRFDTTTQRGEYGDLDFFALSSHWTYELDRSLPAVQALGSGQRVREEFTIEVMDPENVYPPATLLLDIVGDNDVPTAAVTADRRKAPPGSVINLRGSGADVDDGDTAALSYSWSVSPVAQGGRFGDRNAPHTTYVMGQRFPGEVYKLSLRVTDRGGAFATAAIDVTETAPLTESLSGVFSGGLTEDGAKTAVTGTVSHPLQDTSEQGAYGRFDVALGATSWSYTLQNTRTQALAEGRQVREQFAVTPRNTRLAARAVTITVTGVNDAPEAEIITPPASVETLAGGVVTLSGRASDPDSGDGMSLLWSASGGRGVFDLVDVESTTWTAPQVTEETDIVLRLTASDRSSSHSDRVVVAVVPAPQDVPPVFAGTVSIDAQSYTADVAITSLTLPAATGGNGVLSYVITPRLPDGLRFESLRRVLSGAPVMPQPLQGYTYRARDSDANNGDDDTAFLEFSIAIASGASTQPATFGEDRRGEVTEDAADNRVSGTLIVDDPDGEDTLVARLNVAGDYGTFTIHVNGNWNYRLNNALPVVQMLRGGERVNDRFTVTAGDDGAIPAITEVVITVVGVIDPVTASISAPPAGTTVASGGDLAVAGVVVDEDRGPPVGDSYVYGWSTDPQGAGSFANALVARTTWTAPAVDTEAMITLQFALDKGTERAVATRAVRVAADDNAAPVFDEAVYAFVLAENANGGTNPVAVGAVSATDPEGDAITYAIAGGDETRFNIDAASGAITYIGTGEDFEATDGGPSYTLSISATAAGQSAASPVVVTVSVSNVNEAPVARAGADRNVAGGATVTLDGSGSDDPEDDVLSYAWTPPQGTTLDDNTVSRPTFTAPAGLSTGATLSFQLIVTDTGGLASAPDNVIITVAVGANNPPVAVADAITVAEGGTATTLTGGAASVRDNDSDTETATGELTVRVDTAPVNGVLDLNEDGTFSYVHNGGETSSDSFTYRVSDGELDSAPATVMITVTAVDDPTVIAGDRAGAVTEGTADAAGRDKDTGMLTITDPDSDETVIAHEQDDDYGRFEVMASGAWSYTLDNDDPDTDALAVSQQVTRRFTVASESGAEVMVEIVITGANDPPVAMDDAIALAEGGTATTLADGVLSVRANDSDAETATNALTVSVATDPANGTLDLNGDGTFSYVHNGGEQHSDSFTYTLRDEANAGSAPATVTITVTAENDAPLAVDDSTVTNEDAAVAIDVLANDTDVDNDPLSVVALNGTTVNDGQAVAVTDGGTLTLTADGELSFDPRGAFDDLAPGENREVTANYRISDGQGGTDEGVVSIRVSGINDAPAAEAGPSQTVAEGVTVTLDGTGSSDPEDGVLTYQWSRTSGPVVTLGEATAAQPTFTAPTGLSAATTLEFRLIVTDDQDTASEPDTVTITVTGVNDPPVFDSSTYAFDLAENQNGSSTPVAVGTVSATDPDVSDTPVYAITLGDPQNKFEIDSASGAIDYTGTGEDFETQGGAPVYVLSVTATAGGVSVPTTVTVTVTDVDEPPVFDPDTYAFNLAENQDGGASVVAFDAVTATDPEDDAITYSITNGDTNRFGINGASGVIRYIGAGEDFEAPDGAPGYDLTITAAAGTFAATAMVTVAVTNVNEPPVFDPASYAFDLAENRDGSTTAIALAAVTATDPEGDVIAYSITNGGTSRFSIGPASGGIAYTGAGEDFEAQGGPPVYVLSVTATAGTFAPTATVTVTVTDTNDAPTAEAGPPQTVAEGMGVTLDGAASGDPEKQTLSYRWTPPQGTTLSNNTVSHPTFTAPVQLVTDAALTFELVVTDSEGAASAPDSVTITVTAGANDAPTAVAGDKEVRNVSEGARVTLDGTGSGDPEKEMLSYLWMSPQGIMLDDNTLSRPSFDAPSDLVADLPLEFSLVVTDRRGAASVADTITIIVNAGPNDPPIARAGADRSVAEGATVTLDGSGSGDPEKEALNYAWTPPSGITLDDNTVSRPVFTAPRELAFDEVLKFQLIVEDQREKFSQPDSVVITVTAGPNAPPVAVADAITVAEGGTATTLTGGAASVRDNDRDAETARDELVVNVATPPANGTLMLRTDGAFSYVHNGGETSSDRFTYTVTDENGLAGSAAAVTITVTAVDDPTVIAGDRAGAVTEGTADAAGRDKDTGMLTITDPDSDETVIAHEQDDDYGRFEVMASGAWSYTLNNDDPDTDALAVNQQVTQRFTVASADGAEVMVEIVITGANDPPVAADDAIALAEGGTATTLADGASSVRANDSDAETARAGLTVNVATPPAHGTLTLRTDGTFSYVHNGGEQRSDSFTYTLRDEANAGSAPATVSIALSNVNDAPLANAGDDRRVPEGATVTLDGRGSSDPEGDALSYAWAAPPQISLANPGMPRPTFVAPPFFGGQNQVLVFRLLVTDMHGAVSSQSDELLVTVTPASAIDGARSGAVVEAGTMDGMPYDGTPMITRSLEIINAGNDDSFVPQTLRGNYGSFVILEDGSWTYTLENERPATERLRAGQSVRETFTVRASDPVIPPVTVTITVSGTADAPTVVIMVEPPAGGVTGEFEVRLVFSSPVAGFMAEHIDVEHGVLSDLRLAPPPTATRALLVAAAPADAGTDWLAVITPTRNDREVRVAVRAGTVRHLVTGERSYSAVLEQGVRVNLARPTVGIVTIAQRPRGADIEIRFSEPVTGFMEDEVVVSKATAVLSDFRRAAARQGDGDTYAATITFAAAAESTTVQVPADAARSAGDMPNQESRSYAVRAQTVNGAPRTLRFALAAFGRALAAGAVEVLGEHFISASNGPTDRFTLGGQEIDLSPRSLACAGCSAGDPAVHSLLEGEPGGHAPAPWDFWQDDDPATINYMSSRELLSRSSFNYAFNKDDNVHDGAFSMWGRGAVSGFEGKPRSDFTMDGEVTSAYIGMDYRPNVLTRVGVALSHGASDVDYDDSAIGGGGKGKLEAELTSVLPYVHWQTLGGLEAWVALGYGSGDAKLRDGGGTTATDITMQMAAFGVRRRAWSLEHTELAWKASAFAVDVESDAAGNVSLVNTDAQRLRVALEGRVSGETADDRWLIPSWELGLRWDDGDAGNGAGVDLGLGLQYVNQRLGWELRARGRYLVEHEEDDYKEWSAGVEALKSMRVSGRSVILSLEPSWSGTESSQRLGLDFSHALRRSHWTRKHELRLELSGKRHKRKREGAGHYLELKGSLRF